MCYNVHCFLSPCRDNVESGEDSLTEDNDRLRYDSAHCVYMRYCVFVCTEHRYRLQLRELRL